MPILMRWIFRLDYEANFRLINEPGTVMELLSGDDRSYWTEFRESTQHRSVTAAKVLEQQKVVDITITPLNLVASVETVAGVPAEKLGDDEDFRLVDTCLRQVCRHFGISKLNRIGFRLFGFEIRDSGHSGRSPLFDGMRPDLFAACTAELGEVSDMSFTLLGEGEDATSFRLTFGPYRNSDPGHLFEKLQTSGDVLIGGSAYRMSFDLDFYEQNVEYPELSLWQWSRPNLSKAMKFTNSVSKKVF